MSWLPKTLVWLSSSKISEIVLTLLAYSLYAGVLRLSLAPPAFLVVAALRELILPALLAGSLPPLGGVVLFALAPRVRCTCSSSGDSC